MLGLNQCIDIGILVISTTTSHGGSVVSVLVSQAKGRVSFPTCGISFFPTSIFLSSLSNLCRTKWTIHQFGRILCDRHTHLINTPLKYGPAKVGLDGLSTRALSKCIPFMHLNDIKLLLV